MYSPLLNVVVFNAPEIACSSAAERGFNKLTCEIETVCKGESREEKVKVSSFIRTSDKNCTLSCSEVAEADARTLRNARRSTVHVYKTKKSDTSIRTPYSSAQQRET
jgi:hypothetical protein